MAKPGRIGELAGIWCQSGTASDGPGQYRGFVTVRAADAAGGVLIGQLTPAEVRRMALDWLAVAEAADQDAIVFRLMTRDPIGLPAEAVAELVAAMRTERDKPAG